MTNEEIRDRIDSIIIKHEVDDEYVTITNEKDYEALRMAYQVLSRPQGDLISREDALLCLTGEYLENYAYDELITKFARRIKALPSSQPDIEAIRQDIKDIMPQYADGTGWDEGRRFALKEVLHIIDKHIQMRPATPEERQGVKEYIDSISNPTGVNFNNLLKHDEEEWIDECFDKLIKAESEVQE